MKSIYFWVSSLALLIPLTSDATFVLQNGALREVESVATLSVEEHYTLAVKAYEEANYVEAAKQFNILSLNFPGSNLGKEGLFFLGVSQYNNGDYEFANESFSNYLKCQSQPKHFEEAIGYKFTIAEAFRHGAKRHFFGTKQLPKWATGNTLALKIYDEVICSLPCHEYAAQSLYAKGYMLWEGQEWREAIDTYQMLIRRFPKHEYAPLAYLNINRVYLEQCLCEFQNPDLLALAQINTRKFARDFPKDERISDAEADIQAIKEVYARGLYETGQFYERTSSPSASVIYYQCAIDQFPDTHIAALCRKRLSVLNPKSEAELNSDPLCSS